MASGDHATCKSDCSPSEDHPDETLKRRKRHHHHRHHHGHRHRIKHDREKRAEEGSSPVEGFCPNLDEDKEEGEILDEEAVERRDNVRARRKDDSDVESGEIKGDDLEVGLLEDCCPTSMNNFNGTTFKLGVEKDVELNELESSAGVSRGRVRSKGDDSGDSRWARSKSPASNEIFDSPKRSRNVVEMRPATFRSKRDRERSSSPRRSKRRPLSGTRSPSTSVRNPNELLGRSRSRSPNRNRSPKRLYHECSDDSRYYTRKDYDSMRSGQHAFDAYFDRGERLKDMESDRIKRQERERSSSYNRHGSRERHESRDVEFGSDQGRYTDKIDRSSSRTLRDDRENERRQNKYGSRGLENGRDVEKARRRDRPKDKASFVDREQERDRDKTRRSPSYGDQEDGRPSQGHRSKRSKNIERGFNGHSEMQNKFRVEDEMEDYEERVASKLAEQEEDDIEKIKERSRKMTQAIIEKHKKQQQQQQQQPQSEHHTEVTSSHLNNDKTVPDDFPTNNVQKDSPSPFRADVDVLSGIISQGLETKHDSSDVYVADLLFSVAKSPVHNGNTVSEEIPTADGLSDGSPKFERSIDMDMFCDDIFGDMPAVRKQGKGDGLLVERSGLHDNWDDAEGYYCFRFGEVLDGQFEINALHGKGVFSAVVRAKDLKVVKDDPPEVAIKIIRNNETMYKAGCGELIILKKLAGADPEDRRHCVRFFSSFKYHNHLCLVFESLHMNLREVLRKFGRNIGLKLTAVRAYAKQLFIALKHLKNCGVLHCDIKPDNMLVNEAKNVLKLCDFGNAMFAGKNEITPYLVSRFYRAPEIILGLTYDHPMDMWSVGCCLYELYTGKVLFRGATNNEMLRFHMELKGFFPKKMLRKGAFTDQHFDQNFNFYATEEDPVTKKKVKRLLINMKPKDMGSLISSSPGEDSKMVSNFKDLLDRIFVLDPDKRLTVTQALSHPFITAPRWRCLDDAAILLGSLSVEFYLFRLVSGSAFEASKTS